MGIRKPLLEDWPGVWGGWARSYIRRNYWRVKNTIGSEEDCFSECAVQYMECRRRYGATVNTPSQFMALFKKAVSDRFNDLSTKDTKAEYIASQYIHKPSQNIDAVLVAKTRYASKELKQVLHILVNAPNEVMEVLARDFKTPKKIFFHICQSLGINNSQQQILAKELHTIFSQGGRK